MNDCQLHFISLNEHNANKNLVLDVDRNMQLHYSTRNLPLDIVFDVGQIRITYRPNGLKTREKVYDAKGKLNNIETYPGNLVLSFGVPSQILHPEGVLDVSSLSQPVLHYHLKDKTSTTLNSCLCNVRAVVNPSATNTGLISQTNDYYPFGMCYTKMPGPFVNKRKYNGKLKRSGNPDPSGEEQEMPGRWLDYGARFYDPQLGRWHGVDPLAEKYRRWTPYNYCIDNSMRFVDPDGMRSTVFITGGDANPATVQFQAHTSAALKRNAETGQLSAAGGAKSEDGPQLLVALNKFDTHANSLFKIAQIMYKNLIIFALILLSARSFGQSVSGDNSFLPCLPKAFYTVNRIKKVKNYRIVYLSNDSSLVNYRVVTRKQPIANRERIKKGRRYKLEICPWGDRMKYYCMVDYLGIGKGVDIPIREEGQFPDVFYSYDLKGLYYVGGDGDSLRTEDF